MRERTATPRDEARRLARRLAALEEGPMRRRAAARALEELAPSVAAAVLAELVRHGGSEHRVAMAAVGQALVEPGAVSYDALAALYAEAAARGLTEVQVLLVRPRPRAGFEEPQTRPHPVLEGLSLGHRKMLARGDGDPDLLAGLAADGDPTVVRELLRNPRITEPLVVRIAAR